MTKKILGLDLGTNSIGWALIEIDENGTPIRIIAMGSRIIPLNSDDRDQFQKGQAISKNQDRTKTRTQRKGYDRKQLKKSDLKKILTKLNIFPTGELMRLPSLDLWKLRSDAAAENTDISAEQLGRIFYMLNQKRGYKSARSEANQDKKDTEYVTEVKGRYAQLKDKKQTLGQYFYDELLISDQNDKYFQVKKKVYPREAYIEEFDAIIKVQKEKHSFLTNEVIASLRNEIIYYQRKLKSQKGLVSVCEFEGFKTPYVDKDSLKQKLTFTGPKVAPKTSPLFQLCKIWEIVNNISIKIKTPEGSKYKWEDRIPSFEEKKKIVDYLWKNSNLSFPKLIEILDLNKEHVYVNKQISKGLQGNITYTEIQKIIGDSEHLQFNINTIPSKHTSILVDKRTGEILTEEKSLQLNPNLEKEPLYQIWHTIYSIKDLEECRSALIKRFQLDNETAEKLSKIDFNKQAFSNKSNKAMRKILPYLMNGFDYSQSCRLAGYNHSNSLTEKEKASRITDERLELLSKNSLRQPVVEKILNQMINVVNAILEKYGKPDEIRVELARELKQSKDERNDTDIQNGLNKKLNDEISIRLKELGLPTTKRYIQKYKFIFPSRDKKLKEAQVSNQCIYCGELFNLTEALSGDDFDVDHIVPKSLLFDDSQTNKVLVHRICNSNKNNQTAYDYILKKNGAKGLNIYLDRVDDWFKRGIISYNKMQRLKVSFEEYTERKKQKKETESDKKLWENFIDRQLRETQYISRKSIEILQKICNNVTTTEGSVTAKLRDLWGWDDVIMNLQLPKYKGTGQTTVKEWTSDHGKRKHEKEEIINWGKRDDHRHHAIDALVIACTKPGFRQRINTLNASEVRDEMNKKVEEAAIVYNEKLTLLEKYLVTQKPFSTGDVEKEIDKILISFKSGKKVATKGVRKIKVNGKKKIIQKDIIVPRGALHEQFVYGKIKIRDLNKPIKYLFENSDNIIQNEIKHLVKNRLFENQNDIRKAISTLKKNPIYIDKQKEKILNSASCFKDEYVIKYKIQELKAKDVQYIIDKKIRQIVKDRLDAFNGKEKEAFKDVLWFNELKQIPIISVRCFTGLSAVEAIKKNEQGENIGFAKPGSNHHIAIYKDSEGGTFQHLCTFWHAVERKTYKIPYIIKDTATLWNDLLNKNLPQTFLDKLPADKLVLNYSLQENEMFILNLSKELFDEAIKRNDKVLLSKHLYLVWSLSFNKYWFRHHLETKNSELKKIIGARENNRFIEISSVDSFLKLNPIKVRINHLGEITKIGEE
ncbi:MAG TPA: type II CRISPR RNA-guided endonuclease Cas9 [Bacteroidia bacterium]|jgi:CRISPR-associated endonuclease Csn1